MAAVVALAAVVAAVVLLLLTSDHPYEIHARFENAGQLVKGAVVEVAGRKVGTVSSLSLADDGTADIELEITDSDYVPLQRGVRASIRAVGPAGVTSRYVALTPSPVPADDIPDGGTLGLTETSGIVDLDALFSAFDPQARRSLQELIAHSAEVFAGSGSSYYSGLIHQAAPALDQVGGLAHELNSDDAELQKLISTASATAAALASRPGEVQGALVNTARVFNAVNSEQRAFADDLERLAPVLRGTQRTFGRLRSALPAVRADLRLTPDAAQPLTRTLRALDPAARQALPLVEQTRALLPDLNRSLAGFKPLAKAAEPALLSAGQALSGSIPILEALRVYTPDLILGVFGGLGGVASSSYDKLGHYGRLLLAGSSSGTLSGLGRLVNIPDPPGFELHTGNTAPCPGSAAPPAPDGSNPWVPDPDLCDPSQGHP